MTPIVKEPRIEREKTVGPLAALAVTNFYLRIIIVFLCVVIGVEVWSKHDLAYRLGHQRVPVVQTTQAGLAEVIESTDANHKLTASEMQWWLTKWMHDYYSRERTTLAKQYPDILWMTSPARRKMLLGNLERTHWIDTFLRSNEPEVQIRVTSLFLPRRMEPPYQVAIGFDQSYVTANGDTISTRALYAHITFTADTAILLDKDGRRNLNMALHNPLGFQLADWYETDNLVPPE